MAEKKEEYYRIPLFVTLTVSDLDISTAWYRDVLGFSVIFSLPDTEGKKLMTHLRWSKYADIMLVGTSEDNAPHDTKGVGVMLTFAVTTGSVDEIAEKASLHGAAFSGPALKPWNTRDVTVIDPDGYLLTFSQAGDDGMTFEQVMQNIKQSSEK